MAHYIVKPNQKSLKYYIFSTVVMAPISHKMYRAEMVEFIKAMGEGYEGFLDPRPYDEQFPEYFEKPLTTTDHNILKMTYWNGSFWYVTEEDGYFV